jgi:hypothetical protein
MFDGVSRQSLLAASKFLEQVTGNSERALPLLQNPELKATQSSSPERVRKRKPANDAG